MNIVHSLQFDPAPRAGEPLVTRRVPDYFLVSYPSRNRPHKAHIHVHLMHIRSSCLSVMAHASADDPLHPPHFLNLPSFSRVYPPVSSHPSAQTSVRLAYCIYTRTSLVPVLVLLPHHLLRPLERLWTLLLFLSSILLLHLLHLLML